MLVIPLLSTCG